MIFIMKSDPQRYKTGIKGEIIIKKTFAIVLILIMAFSAVSAFAEGLPEKRDRGDKEQDTTVFGTN